MTAVTPQPSERPLEIQRSSNLERALFAFGAKMPNYTAPIARAIHPFSEEKRDLLTLKYCLLDNSQTFAVAIHAMGEDSPDVRDDLTVVHQGFKIIDFVDEKKELSRQQKQECLDEYLDTVEYPTDGKISSMRDNLQSLGFTPLDEEHQSLIQNIPVLVRSFQNRPQMVKDSFLKYGRKMTEGFAKMEEREIKDMRGVDLDCLVAAGYVGYAVNGIYVAREIISPEQEEELRIPARTVGKAVQLGNNLRDTIEDVTAGISHWPFSEVIKLKNALKLVGREREDALKDFYKNNFKDWIDYTKKIFLDATKYVDMLPRGPPYGPKIFPALSLALYSQIVRAVDNPDFLISDGQYAKPSAGDLFDTKDIATALIKQDLSIRPLIEYTLKTGRPISSYPGLR